MKRILIIISLLIIIITCFLSIIFLIRRDPDIPIIDTEGFAPVTEEIITDPVALPETMWEQYCEGYISTDELATSLTLEQKAKQLLAPIYTGHHIDTAQTTSEMGFYVLIKIYHYPSAEQVAIKTGSLSKEGEIPAFIGIDAEGRPLQRLSWHKFTHISDINQKNIMQDISVIRAAGFNWSLGPVVDLPITRRDWIYSRSIGTNKEEVLKVAQTYIDSMRSEGILTSAKHFPGHGDTSVDSHHALPSISSTKKNWDNNQGWIYKQLESDSIITGHLLYPDITSEVSSSSAYWTSVLRDEIGFDGLIITDDINMRSPRDTHSCHKLIKESFDSGADVVMFAHGEVCNTQELLEVIVEDQFNYDEKVINVLKAKREYLCP